MRNSRERLRRLENLALLTLHAFPALHCSAPVESDTSAAFLFQTYREQVVHQLASMSVWQRAALQAIWPLAAVLTAAGMTVANGRFIARRYRRSVAAQFLAQMRLAFAAGMPPNFYYSYDLHDPQNAARAHEYLHRAYLKRSCGLYKRLYSSSPKRNQKAKILNDKLALHRFCVEHGVPTARLFAVVHDGTCDWSEPGASALPKCSLFVKPRKANGGAGAQRWLYRDSRYHGHMGATLSAPELTRHIAELSRDQSHLIFECLANHPDLQDLTAGALSTLRIYTIWNETSEVEHLFTMFRMSRTPGQVVDNVCRGGLAAQVDAATGTLGKATDLSMFARTGWLAHHPTTGASIYGRRIPFWTEAVELARSAHRQLPAAIFVGWDIAVTEHGPVIVEGNKAPDLEVEQRLSGPWGNQRFGRLMEYHLRAAIAGATATQSVSVADVPPVLPVPEIASTLLQGPDDQVVERMP